MRGSDVRPPRELRPVRLEAAGSMYEIHADGQVYHRRQTANGNWILRTVRDPQLACLVINLAKSRQARDGA